MERESRSDFQILIVDRDEIRRGEILQWLTELGFRHVSLAAAPTSAASFADANPPHIAFIACGTPELDHEAKDTALRLRRISRETQLVLHYSENADDVIASRSLAHSLRVWDLCGIPPLEVGSAQRRMALELCVDRACRRLYSQFESEAWKERYEQVVSDGAVQPKTTRDRLIHSIRSYSRMKDPDGIIGFTCQTFSDVIGGRPSFYFRWLPIRNAFVLSHSAAVLESDLKPARGLGFSPPAPEKIAATLTTLSEFQELRAFMRDVFKVETYTALLQGPPEEPIGIFVLAAAFDDASVSHEIEALAHLFDLTWTRIQALKDRHMLERVDRGTGLPNKTAFRESLDFECVRARRLRHPLSAACIEVSDSGRDLEAKIGSSAESVMKVIGATLRRTLRGTDFVARVDRKRFAVLMPHTSVAEAAGVIDRICRMTEKLKLPALEGGGVDALRVRAGVAEYPRLAKDAIGLFQGAEDALTATNSHEAQGPTKVRVMVVEIPPGFEPDYEPMVVETK